MLVFSAHSMGTVMKTQTVFGKNSFCSKNAETCHLPPTKDALKHHVIRANYQVFILSQCLKPTASTPSLDDHGWVLKDCHLTIHWMGQQPALQALLYLIRCKCSKDHCTRIRCSCTCIYICVYTNCINASTHNDFSDREDEGN